MVTPEDFAFLGDEKAVREVVDMVNHHYAESLIPVDKTLERLREAHLDRMRRLVSSGAITFITPTSAARREEPPEPSYRDISGPAYGHFQKTSLAIAQEVDEIINGKPSKPLTEADVTLYMSHHGVKFEGSLELKINKLRIPSGDMFLMEKYQFDKSLFIKEEDDHQT